MSSTEEKSAYHHGDLRQSLIDGAIALMRETGIHEVSLRQVARKVGVSHNAPYRHFADKAALLAVVAEQGFQSLHSTLDRARHPYPNQPSQQLQAIGMAYVSFAIAYPEHYRVMFGNDQEDLNPYPGLARAAQQAFLVLVHTIQAGQAIGVFRADDPLALARVAWSLVHGQAMLILDRKFQFTTNQELTAFTEFSTQILLMGLIDQRNV